MVLWVNELKEFLGNWQSYVLAIFIILIVIQTITKLRDFFYGRFGIETSSMRERREQREFLSKTASEVNEIKTKYQKNFDKMSEQLNEVIQKGELRDQELFSKISELIENQKLSDDRRDHISAMEIRFSLTKRCENAIRDGKITFKGRKSIEDLYEVYHDEKYLGMNSYVTGLVEKVRELEIIGDKE